jgi:pimeloyl-ACP methyl ester carboxylesterase
MNPAPPWVLLRGLAREAGHWGDFLPALQAALPGQRLILLDLPGNGARHAEHSPTTLAGLVTACRAELQRQGVRGPVRLLAMSLGAMVATAWADAHPAEVAGAVLISTNLRAHSPLWQRLRPAGWPRLLQALLSTDPVRAENLIWQLTSARPPQADTLAHWVALRQAHPVRRANVLRQLAAAARFRGPRPAPPVPLLLLVGQGDALVDARCSQALARAWQVPLVVHPTAGHDLPLDAGPWVAEQVRRWVGS